MYSYLVGEAMLNEEVAPECFIKGNIEIYYDRGFSIIDHTEDNSLGIIHRTDVFFRTISSDEIIIDCVLDIRIEYSSKKNKVIFEVGMDDQTSGFCSKLLNVDEKYVIYLSTYTQEEKEKFRLFENI